MNVLEQRTIAVANKFVAALRQEIGAENFGEVRRRNRADSDIAVCHSHDFCDANVLMHKAVKKIQGDCVLSADEASQRQTEYETLWNDAWSLVRQGALS